MKVDLLNIQKKDIMNHMAELFAGDDEVQAKACLTIALSRKGRTGKQTVALVCRSKKKFEAIWFAFRGGLGGNAILLPGKNDIHAGVAKAMEYCV